MDDAAQRIAAERARDPRVVELAEAASLAARLESELLRALRLACVPGANASVEADLWFGPLASVRSPGVLMLDDEVVTELRRQVALDLKGPLEAPGGRARIAAITALIADVHAGAPPLIRLEESVIAGLLLGRDPARIDDELRSVLGAMAHQPSRRGDLASWAWAALPRLPLDHVALPSVGALAVATGLTMQEALPMQMRVAEGALAGVPTVLAPVTGSVELAVWRDGPWLVFAHAADNVPPTRRIRVPATTPRYVEVATEAGDATLVALPPQGTERVRVERAVDVRLRNLDGEEWRVGSTRQLRPDVVPTGLEVKLLYFNELTQLTDTAMAAEIERDFDSLITDGEWPALVLVGGAGGRDLARDVPVLPRFCDGASVLIVPGENDARFDTGLETRRSPRPSSDIDAVEMMFSDSSEKVWQRAFGHFLGMQRGFGTTLRSFEGTEGPRPGCFTATLASRAGRIGICGLNTWYLDPALLGETTPDIDARLLPVEIDRWCEQHDLTILLLGAAPERLRPHRRLHFEYAVARHGRFDLVLGAAQGMIIQAGTYDRLDYAMLPGPRYAVLHLRSEGSQTAVQIWPRLRGTDRFDSDLEMPMTSSGPLDVRLRSRKQPPPPLSPTSATECLALLRDGRSIALSGPADSDIEEIARRVRGHLEHAGYSPITVSTEDELVAARAARIPQPVYCTSSVTLRPHGGLEALSEDLFFYQLAAGEDPMLLAGVADIVVNNDLTVEEALEYFPDTDRETVIAIHQRAAGIAGVMARLIRGVTEEELSEWLRKALANDELEVLTAYREILDDHPWPAERIAAIGERERVRSGLFRRDGSERNPLYRELLGHRWIDVQLERRGWLPEPQFVLVLGTSEVAKEVARALGARGRDYGIVVRGEPQRELVRIFVEALPATLPRYNRVQVILDPTVPAVIDPVLGSATIVSVDPAEQQRIVERAHAVIDASGTDDSLDIAHVLAARAEQNSIPVYRPNLRDRPRDVAAHVLRFLESELRSHARMLAASAIRELLLVRSVPTMLPPPIALQHRLYRAAMSLVPPTSAPLRALGEQRMESDEILLEAFAHGDAGAFETLMQRHLGWMVAWARKQGLLQTDAEDAAQEAFMALVRKAAQLHLDGTFRGYLYGLLRIQVLRARRFLKRRPGELLEEDEGSTEVASSEPSPTMKVLARRAHDELAEAMLQTCTLREQEVLLFDLEGAADRDIAAALEMTEGNVRVVRHRAISKLRKVLGPAGSGSEDDDGR